MSTNECHRFWDNDLNKVFTSQKSTLFYTCHTFRNNNIGKTLATRKSIHFYRCQRIRKNNASNIGTLTKCSLANPRYRIGFAIMSNRGWNKDIAFISTPLTYYLTFHFTFRNNVIIDSINLKVVCVGRNVCKRQESRKQEEFKFYHKRFCCFALAFSWQTKVWGYVVSGIKK